MLSNGEVTDERKTDRWIDGDLWLNAQSTDKMQWHQVPKKSKEKIHMAGYVRKYLPRTFCEASATLEVSARQPNGLIEIFG